MERFLIDKLSAVMVVLQEYKNGSLPIPEEESDAEISMNKIRGLLDDEEVFKAMEKVNGATPAFTLELSRPIIFLALKLFPDGKEEHKTARINPGVPIPAAATLVHKIKDEDVKDCPTFPSIAKSLLEWISGSDIVGFNSNRFDVPMLYFHFLRMGLDWDWRSVNMIDAGNIFKIKEERTLSRAVEFYLGRKHEDAHSAEADIIATKQVFFAQLGRYDDLPKSLEELALLSNFNQERIDMAGNFTKDAEGDIIFNFGKHRGRKAKNEPGFLNWMLGQNFPLDTKRIAQKLISGE
jgi:DNA polymerase-3 subunit epsilon